MKKEKVRVYLSGKLTDGDKVKSLPNMQKFFDKQKEFEEKGYEVLNPANWERPDYKWEDYIIKDLLVVINLRPDMYFFKDWQDSQGARLEHGVAMGLGLNMFYEEPLV